MELFLLVLGLLLIVLDFSGIKEKRTIGIVAIAGILIDAVIGILTLSGKEGSLTLAGSGSFRGFIFFVDPLALFFKELFCLILFMVLLLSIDYMDREPAFHREYYSLLIFAGIGMMTMVSAGDFLLLFISMELISIPLYVLAASRKKSRESAEAGIKYFILGAFSSALFLYGISVFYGCSGSLIFLRKFSDTVSPLLSGIGQGNGAPLNIFQSPMSGAFLLAMVLTIVGLGFKVAGAPFHMWAPDVYEGSPMPVTAFISVAPKAAGMAVIMRFFMGGLSALLQFWAPIFCIIAVLSIVIGNLAALRQDNIKRLLAYSGIAQIGYMLLGLAGVSAKPVAAITSVIFYVALYAVTNLGAFAAAIICSHHYGSENIRDFRGLYRKSPSLAFMMLLALLSLAGIPPLSGFIGKFYLFASAYEAFDHKLIGFVLIAIIFSVISLFYYLRILKYMLFEEADNPENLTIPGAFKIVLSLSTLTVLFLGLIPSFYDLIQFLATFIL
jgi:NADH-quinone oxidoreductase subunit N